jgi:RNA polymerase sigma-54 factor
MKQSHQLKQKQNFKQGYFLSQQYLKLTNILHLTGQALNDYVAIEVENNPALEYEEEETSEAEAEVENILDTEFHDYGDDLFELKNKPVAHEYYEAPVLQFNSLQDSLKEQVHQMRLSDEETETACYLIDELDDDGYLRLPLAEVADNFAFANGKINEVAVFEKALQHIQQCDPPGIGAVNLQQCLLLQLERLHTKDMDLFIKEHALCVLKKYYVPFSQRNYNVIKSRLKVSDDDWKKILELILKLNPKPVIEANKYEIMQNHIIPDFEISIDGEKIYIAATTDGFSKIRVNPDTILASLSEVSEKEKKKAENFMSTYIEEATLLVNALNERETTLKKIIYAIASRQQQFFITGDRKDLVPMILQDIAFATEYDISTVSRITSNKYVQTPHGIIALKSLFMRNIHADEIKDATNTASGVQSVIKALVDQEDKQNPLSDEAILKALKEKGLKIARRTVVKYREKLGILNSYMRKNKS